MAKDDDMRERLQSLETKFDRLEKKVDQLPTKADLVAFTDAITDKMRIMLGDATDSIKKAVEGCGASLERIERDLNEFRSEWKNKSEDTDRVLTDHDNRIVALDRTPARPHTPDETPCPQPGRNCA